MSHPLPTKHSVILYRLTSSCLAAIAMGVAEHNMQLLHERYFIWSHPTVCFYSKGIKHCHSQP